MRTIGILIFMVMSGLSQPQGLPQGGRGGQGGGQVAQAVPWRSRRPPGASLGTIRIGAADSNMWFGWHVAAPATAFKGLTYSEALAKADSIAIAHTGGLCSVLDRS